MRVQSWNFSDYGRKGLAFDGTSNILSAPCRSAKAQRNSRKQRGGRRRRFRSASCCVDNARLRRVCLVMREMSVQGPKYGSQGKLGLLPTCDIELLNKSSWNAAAPVQMKQTSSCWLCVPNQSRTRFEPACS